MDPWDSGLPPAYPISVPDRVTPTYEAGTATSARLSRIATTSASVSRMMRLPSTVLIGTANRTALRQGPTARQARAARGPSVDDQLLGANAITFVLTVEAV